MSRLNRLMFGLLGPFTLEADVGRSIAISLRAKKARALLAYLAMKPGYQARREELATLFWGDSPDELARHSLRQCLISLRQDLSVCSDVLIVDRDTIALSAHLAVVDARRFLSLAEAGGPAEIAEAAELWRGPFLPDLVLDIEGFDGWREREADRLSAAAAGVFEALCRTADAARDGDRAVAAVQRLIELDPTREDRQQTALRLLARYRGRDAALSHAKLLVDLLRSELDVSPEPATRALIEQIKKSELDVPDVPDRAQPVARKTAEPASMPDLTAELIASREAEPPALHSASLAELTETAKQTPPAPPFWRRTWAAAAAGIAIAATGAAAVLGLPRLSLLSVASHHNQNVVVLPFAADDPVRAYDPAFARILTQDLIGYLSRFGNLRVISEPTSEVYSDSQIKETLLPNLDAQYAIVGHVHGADSGLRVHVELADTVTRMNVWSDTLQHQRSDPALDADEVARGIARMLSIEIATLTVQQVRTKPNAELTLADLVDRGYWAMRSSTTRENLSNGMKSFSAALQRNPHYLPALLAVARVQILATMNFIDLDPRPDLGAAERLLNSVLEKYPNSISALYSLALLQKQRHQYEASMRSLQRCLELNPSFLPAQAQIGDILARTGQPQKGLEQVLQTIQAATPSDPSIGHWYLFAAEAELELGHTRAALDWALRADTFMPGSALVQAWLASIYATLGDQLNAKKYAAILWETAPDRTQIFIKTPVSDRAHTDDGSELQIFKGLRLALGASPS